MKRTELESCENYRATYCPDHRREALRHLADEWHELPAGTFRKEGTEVATCLFLITNHNT